MIQDWNFNVETGVWQYLKGPGEVRPIGDAKDHNGWVAYWLGERLPGPGPQPWLFLVETKAEAVRPHGQCLWQGPTGRCVLEQGHFPDTPHQEYFAEGKP